MGRKAISSQFVVTTAVDGDNGLNTAVVSLYRRLRSAPESSDMPNDTLTYTFASGLLAGDGFNGWSQSIPAATEGTKIYVTMATAVSREDTDDIEPNEWSGAVEYVSDGINSAPVLIYKRADAIADTDKPLGDSVYFFNTGLLTGSLNGWSQSIPDTPRSACWVRQATASSSYPSDTIADSEWSDARKLVEDGESAFIIDLDNESDSFGTDSDSKVLVQQVRSTVVSMYVGTEPQTLTALDATLYYEDGTAVGSSVATVTKTLATGVVDVTINRSASGTSFTHSGLYALISASCAGGIDGTARFTITKVMSGEPGVNPVIYQLELTQGSLSYSRNSDNELVAKSNSVTVRLKKTEGNNSSIISSHPTITYSWGFDDSTAQASGQAIGTTITVNAHDAGNHSNIWIELSTGEKENLPIITDGEKGGSGENGKDTASISVNGYCDGSDGTAVGTASITFFDGSTTAEYTSTSRGVMLVTISYDATTKTYTSTKVGEYDIFNFNSRKDALATALTNAITAGQVVCLASYKAIGWNSNLIDALESSGSKGLPVIDTGRYPFAFIGDGSNSSQMMLGLESTYSADASAQLFGASITNPSNESYEYALDKSVNSVVVSANSSDTTLLNDTVSVSMKVNGKGGKLYIRTYIASYRRSGSSYELIASSFSNNFVFTDYAVDSSIDAITIYAFKEEYTGTSPESQPYLAKAEIVMQKTGSTGRMYYMAGRWNATTPYTRTDKLCPVVYHEVDASQVYVQWWFLDADYSLNNRPTIGGNVWGQMEKFSMVMTDAIFVKEFAQFGSAVITKDWLISIHGTIGGNVVSGTFDNPQILHDLPVYTFFEPLSPDSDRTIISTSQVLDSDYQRIAEIPVGSSAFILKIEGSGAAKFLLEDVNGDQVGEVVSRTSSEVVEIVCKDVSYNTYYLNARGSNASVSRVTQLPFLPNMALDLLTGEIYGACGNFKVKKDGSVTIKGDVSISGAFMYERVTMQTLSNASVYPMFDFITTEGVASITGMKASTYILTDNDTMACDVALPPPDMFPNMSIELVIPSTSTDVTTGTRLCTYRATTIEEQDQGLGAFVDIVDDAQTGEAYNPFWHPKNGLQHRITLARQDGAGYTYMRLVSARSFSSHWYDGYDSGSGTRHLWYIKDYVER